MSKAEVAPAPPASPVARDEDWVEPSAEAIAANAELYEITYDEATRTLDDQNAEVTNARTRAVQFLAFVGSATAFLLGSSLSGASPRGVAFYLLATSGTVLAALGIFCVAALLNPWGTPLFHRVEPRVLLVNYIERQVPIPNKAEMFRELSLHFEEWRGANEVRLRRIRWWYFASIVLGALQLVVWATLTWLVR